MTRSRFRLTAGLGALALVLGLVPVTSAAADETVGTSVVASSPAGETVDPGLEASPAGSASSTIEPSDPGTVSTVPDVPETDSAAPERATAAAIPAGVEVVGAACLPGQGVTVMVDLTPVHDEIRLGCAIGDQASGQAALEAAGFTIGFGAFSMLTVIDGVDAEALTTTFWSFFVSTDDGTPTGAPGTAWSFAQSGVTDFAPVASGTALAFLLQDWTAPSRENAIGLDELPGYEPGDGPVAPPAGNPAADGDARAAAGWLARQLAAHGNVLPGPDGENTDWGLTIDALLALAAAGVAGDQIAATAGELWNSGTGYLGTPAESVANWGRIAKTALALQVAGLDPTAFPDGSGGTRNLITELRLAQNADGSFGSFDFAFLHSLAVFTLARTTGGVPESSVTWLLGEQCDDPAHTGHGGFSWDGGCADVDVDGTALAVQALVAAGVAVDGPELQAALTWLAAQQDSTGIGALPASSGGANTSGTGLGGQAFAATGRSEQASAAAGYIGSLQVTCEVVLANPATVVDGNVGAIAFDQTGWEELADYGIDDFSRDQWTRATAQAILGLGLPAMGAITAEGADPATPAAAECVPPTTVTTTDPPSSTPQTTDATTTTVTTSDSTTVSTSPDTTTTPTTASSTLSSTGVTESTGPTALVGVLLLFAGAGLMLVLRLRREQGRHHL